MKSIFFHATPHSISKTRTTLPLTNGTIFSKARTIQQLKDSFNQTGNRGNTIHSEAPQKLFKYNSSNSTCGNIVHVYRQSNDFDSEFNNKFDCIIFSLANFIRKNQNHEELAYVIEKIKIPIFVFSAGLQSNLDSLESLTNSTVNLINVLSKKAHIFGVRGEKTKSFLDKNGITNINIVGCPSLYAYPENIQKIKPNINTNNLKVATAGHFSKENLTKDTSKSKRAMDLHRFLMQESHTNTFSEITYVFQDEVFSYDSLENEKIFDDSCQEFAPREIVSYLNNITKSESFSYINKFVMFQDPQSWRAWMKNKDIYFGDRFHGGIASLQCAKPTIIIAGNTRVKEMTEFFNIPSTNFSELRNNTMKDIINEKHNTECIKRFIDTYNERYNSFQILCKTHGLEFAHEC